MSNSKVRLTDALTGVGTQPMAGVTYARPVREVRSMAKSPSSQTSFSLRTACPLQSFFL